MTIPTTLPAVLELGHGLRLEFAEQGELGAYAYTVTATIYEALSPGCACVTYGEGTSAARAMLSLMAGADQDISPDEFPASVALALRDLAHQAVDIVAPTLSPEPLESAVFAEPIPTPEPAATPVYDPKTHQWKVGDWFTVVYAATPADLKFLQLCGAGPHRVTSTTARRWVMADKAQAWFGIDQIRPCAPPTEEANR